jgi:cation transport regulator ChaB
MLTPCKLHHVHRHAASAATDHDLPFEAGDFPGAFKWLDAHANERGAYGKASKALGVAVNTLKTRYSAGDAGPTRKGPAPRLGADVEKVLVDWIKLGHQTASSIPPEVLRNKAREIARSFGIDEDTVGGPKWTALFFRRHPELSMR